MSDTAPELTTIERTVRIAASPETLWSFWTDPKRLCQWWASDADVVPEPGGTIRVVMGEGPIMRGTFVELDPPRRLVFSFGWEEYAPGEPLAPGSTQVEVTLRPDGDETVLVLRHSSMPSTHAADHEKGWTYLLTERLVAAATA